MSNPPPEQLEPIVWCVRHLLLPLATGMAVGLWLVPIAWRFVKWLLVLVLLFAVASLFGVASLNPEWLIDLWHEWATVETLRPAFNGVTERFRELIQKRPPISAAMSLGLATGALIRWHHRKHHTRKGSK